MTAFSQQGPRTVCILSANGAISNVTLGQPAMSGGTVTYKGRFEIISLSGSFLLTDSDGNQSSRSSGLSVFLAGSDGRVFDGGVAGSLVAATPVQVIYVPVRDLNGIPGATSLVICLTRYQREYREDIMIMVELMGAQVSKPLIATKVMAIPTTRGIEKTTQSFG
ncbi:putative AT-hook motif nuclear-localized protein [Helianthus annuus]|nr:putative AT-hook motif nuclear-localized protein [Helianthus annuus]